MNDPRIMVVDDDQVILESIKDYLDDYSIRTFYDSKEAAGVLRREYYDVIVGDYRMPDLTGLDLFMEGKRYNAYNYGILLTAYADKDLLEQFINKNLVNAILEKPLDLEALKKTIDEGIRYSIAKKRKEEEIRELKQKYEAALKETGYLNEKIIGTGTGLKQVFEQVKIISTTDESILLTGETGTGKEVIARTIHALSKRKDGPFIKINCGAIPETLIESEIFGYVRGAFSGAYSDKPGKIELADKGSLFLDEITELKTEMQTKLLHVIQEKKVERLGSNKSIDVDFRLITATNRNLEVMLKENTFRADLFYLINAFHLHLPPLRERTEDLGELIAYFLDKFTDEINRYDISVEKEAIEKLKTYHWPGNIWELENVIKRAVILLDKNTRNIKKNAFDYLFYPPSASSESLDTSLENLSREIIEKRIDLKTIESRILENIVKHFNGNIMEAVRNTCIPKDKFYRNRTKENSPYGGA
ncbi:MAG: hypothetical protein DRP87_14965 [Spirochaetes bacterium]|nr:MAG: hypothetical protein DRP87_14965 [Spirochaetota bacterium]